MIEEKLIVKEEVSLSASKVYCFQQLLQWKKETVDVNEMRVNLEKTINRERVKAAEEERANNLKEFERIYELEDKLRLTEVKISTRFVDVVDETFRG